MMYDNLKYARRAGSDITLCVVISHVHDIEPRGGITIRHLDITDGYDVMRLAVFGKYATIPYHAGQRIQAGPVYWSEQWENFSLARNGAVSVII